MRTSAVSESVLTEFLTNGLSTSFFPAAAVPVSVTACQRLLSRLAADRALLEREFGIREAATVTRLRQLGDRHCGGDSVVLVDFEDTQSLVYKPRSLAADVAYQKLPEWMGGAIGTSFYTPRLLDRQGYGWSEYIRDFSCSTADEAAAFYYRLGAQLCLSALLGAKDVHAENLVAAGAHPVIVDLECLLEPDWRNPFLKSPVCDALIETMILPRPVLFEGTVYEFSAVAGDPAAHSSCSGFRNRPRLNGCPLPFQSYQQALSEGFDAASDAVIRNKASVPIDPFRGIETRMVLRGTFHYLNIISESLNQEDRPAYVRQAAMRDLPAAELMEIARSEARDMEEFDVPLFYARTDHSRIFDSRRVPVLELDCANGYDALCRRLASYSREDCCRGLDIIAESFAGNPANVLQI